MHVFMNSPTRLTPHLRPVLVLNRELRAHAWCHNTMESLCGAVLMVVKIVLDGHVRLGNGVSTKVPIISCPTPFGQDVADF